MSPSSCLCQYRIMDAINSLEATAREIDKYVARGGWDGQIHLFALVEAQKALAENPALEADLPPGVNSEDLNSPQAMLSIEQEDLPAAAGIGELLAQIAWPDTVDGAALTVERILLPPAAEAKLPKDPQAALKALENHPDKQEARITASVTRSGDAWCIIRLRAYDTEKMVLSGAELAPGITQALAQTFQD